MAGTGLTSLEFIARVIPDTSGHRTSAKRKWRSCISSYSAHPNDHRVGGKDHVSVVLRCYLPVNTLYIPSHVVDHRCDTTVESFVVHSLNIGHRSRAWIRRKGKLCSRTSLSNALYV
jgi:hypothetical protein